MGIIKLKGEANLVTAGDIGGRLEQFDVYSAIGGQAVIYMQFIDDKPGSMLYLSPEDLPALISALQATLPRETEDLPSEGHSEATNDKQEPKSEVTWAAFEQMVDLNTKLSEELTVWKDKYDTLLVRVTGAVERGEHLAASPKGEKP